MSGFFVGESQRDTIMSLFVCRGWVIKKTTRDIIVSLCDPLQTTRDIIVSLCEAPTNN
jgi:hypothetical protein